jgi:hypothetical protein
LGRIPALNPDYVEALERLGIAPGSTAAKAVARVVREVVAAEELPLPDDDERPLPRVVIGLSGRRVVSAYAREIPRQRLRLWYLAHGAQVEFVLVTRA